MSFVEAAINWQKKQEEFICKNLKKRQIAERSEILLTIPKECEEEFKALAKQRRLEYDSVIPADENLSRQKIAALFEKENPPPRRDEYN